MLILLWFLTFWEWCNQHFTLTLLLVLTGKFGPHVREEDLTRWAEQSYGKVRSVIFGFNQVVIVFRTKKSAVMCLRQVKVEFRGITLRAYPNNLSFTNGIHLEGLPFYIKKIDVEDIFTKFGDIAFIKGPLGSPISEDKYAVVVFQHK